MNVGDLLRERDAVVVRCVEFLSAYDATKKTDDEEQIRQFCRAHGHEFGAQLAGDPVLRAVLRSMSEIDNLLTTQNLMSCMASTNERHLRQLMYQLRGVPFHLLRMGTFEVMFGIAGPYDQQDALEVCMFRCGATLHIPESLVQEIVMILRNLWARSIACL
jgi:hypothetical protein